MTIGKNIKYYRQLNKLTQRDLAKRLEIVPTSISAWENGRNKPLMHNIEKMANIFGIKKSELIGKDEILKVKNDITPIYVQLNSQRQQKVYTYATKQLEEQNNVIQLEDHIEEIDYKEIPLYGGASAGTGQQVFDNPVEWVSVPSNTLPKQNYDIMLKVVGDSMQPAFEDGEYIFVNKTPDIRSGQFVVIIVDGEAFLKKIYIEDDHIRLVSLNIDYEDIIVDSTQDINIVGTVVL